MASRFRDLELESVEETGKELGRGSFGVVMELKVKGLRCAGKKLHSAFLSPQGEALQNRFLEECEQHSKLCHPHIVQLIGVYTSPGEALPMLVLECMHSSLTACLDNHPNIPMHFKKRILHDVSLGLQFLHDRNDPIVHRDLTANNVLVTEDLRAKISDLGVTKVISMEAMQKHTTAPGTSAYMPPEAIVHEPVYNAKLDIFSFGVMILHVVSQKCPMAHLPPNSTDYSGRLVPNSEVQRRANYFREIDSSDLLYSLAEQCLSNSPEARPTARRMVEELDTVVAAPSTSSIPLLEAYRKKEEAEKRRDELWSQSQEVESQLHKILQDMQGKFTLNEPDLDEVIKQLHAVVQGTRSVLYGTRDNTYDSTQHRFIVAYKPPASASDSGGDKSSVLHITSAASSPYPLSLTVRAPVNITFSGTYVKTVISGLTKSFGLAVSGDKLYIVDREGWKAVHVCSISGNGPETRSIIDASSYRELAMSLDKCWYPGGMAIDGEQNIILADTSSHRVVKFSPDGSFLGSTGKLMKSGSELGEFNEPIGVTLANNGELYVADRSNHRIQILNSNLLSQRSFGQLGKGPCEFTHPWDVAFDSKGNIYVVDCSNYCIKVFTRGFKSFVRQIGSEGPGDDQFLAPASICIDANDYVYVADKSPRSCCVKIFNPSGEFVMRFGSCDDKKPEFCFNRPMGIALDSRGHVFVSDSYNGRVLMFE